jgi:hypothetical protein
MNKSTFKREIIQNIQDIKDSLVEIENIVDDINDIELSEATIAWLDKVDNIIKDGAAQTLFHIENID